MSHLQSGEHCIYHSGRSEPEPILTILSLQALAKAAALQGSNRGNTTVPPHFQPECFSKFSLSVPLPWFRYRRVINSQNLCLNQVNSRIPCLADSWTWLVVTDFEKNLLFGISSLKICNEITWQGQSAMATATPRVKRCHKLMSGKC